MKNGNGIKKKGGVSPLDIFIVILVFMCIAGVIVRIYMGHDGVLPSEGVESADYAVSFEIKSALPELSTYLVSGERLYDAEGNLFGTVSGSVTVTPAEQFYEDADGKYVPFYSSYQNDIRGTVTVSGHYTDYGFLVNGKTYIAPNYETELHTGMSSFSLRITGISKVQS